ncbi:MAG: 4-(cytidine 5'-diphospho)-2-C-methyl-D-erythritol kinase [Bacteroidales bacterium]|nr:4-(cytidine 5'-diphospho)-2-C-methyl-D-erythritol kinase [Bacteroidales bacterium]
MTIFPNAKINIGLNIIAKRDDDYHNIESVFYPVPLRDALEFVVLKERKQGDEMKITGLELECGKEENLVIKAVNLLRGEYNIPPLKIHLHKVIPDGSGLGGGSSDAAFMLKYINRYFKLGISNDRLKGYALELGSDCVFFIDNKPAIAGGRGEKLININLDLSNKYLLIVHPRIRTSTAEAYSLAVPSPWDVPLSSLIKEPVAEWHKLIRNDFQKQVSGRHAVIGEIIEKIYNDGALYCSMSGSGSSVYGIFNHKPGLSHYSPYWVWQGIME